MMKGANLTKTIQKYSMKVSKYSKYKSYLDVNNSAVANPFLFLEIIHTMKIANVLNS